MVVTGVVLDSVLEWWLDRVLAVEVVAAVGCVSWRERDLRDEK